MAAIRQAMIQNITQNTLIDNSTEALTMKSVIKNCINTVDPPEIMSATGYWDLPGMELIYDELKVFLEKENTKLRLIIGKEPVVRLYQQSSPATTQKDDCPGQYLKKDINDLALIEKYQKVVELILSYCTSDFENSKSLNCCISPNTLSSPDLRIIL